MNYPDHIITIDKFEESSFKEKNSVFIGQVFHCESENEANEILTSIKKKYYDANHHCFAYKFLDGKIKYSDDGEPSGTAGIRILNVIEHLNLLNILVIVIRHFGGVKLGVGPLGKAYHISASMVLDKAIKVKKILYQEVKVISDFEHISQVHRILLIHKGIIEETNYGKRVNFNCLIKPSEFISISEQLIALSKGQINVVSTSSNRYK